MLGNLVASLIAAEALVTTEAKAKALRPVVEKVVTKARKAAAADDPIRRLQLLRDTISFIRDREMASKLFDDIGPRYLDRPGGYTRILKLGPRHGDNAAMARIEFV
jgi:large subunit ribosomal protein L17